MTPAKQRAEQRRKSRRPSATGRASRGTDLYRALLLIRLFDSRHWVTYDDIREAFGGVCHKTATRWIKEAEAAGWPIVAEPIESIRPGRSCLRFRLLRRSDR